MKITTILKPRRGHRRSPDPGRKPDDRSTAPVTTSWRDDKRYPYLQLTLSEPYPRLLVTRRPYLVQKDRYFGPFVHVSAMRETLRLVHRNLGIRQCDIVIDRKLERPCLLLRPSLHRDAASPAGG